jgi:dipeptidyl aminopeptidase/acylaminoacyl peptidase
VSPDGHTLAYVERTPAGNLAAWTLPLGGGAPPARLAPPGFHVSVARFSPDGRYVAFVSDESGTWEVYIAPFPGPGERIRLSTAGASVLRWPRDGNEILYLSLDRKVVSVPVRTAPVLQLGTPKVLFTLAGDSAWPDFVATADGQRILAIVPRVDADQLPLTVVAHWPRGIRQ